MNYHDIKHEDMLNGDGIRTTVFCSGCNHQCPGCQNPMTWDENGGIAFDDKAKAEVLDSLNSKWIAGVTFSGGDPLYPANRETFTELAKEIKEKYPDKTIWVYTGYTFDKVKDLDIMKYVDVCVDGPYIEAKRDVSIAWRGSTNQRVIDVKKSLLEGKIVLHYDDEKTDKFDPYEAFEPDCCGCDRDL